MNHACKLFSKSLAYHNQYFLETESGYKILKIILKIVGIKKNLYYGLLNYLFTIKVMVEEDFGDFCFLFSPLKSQFKQNILVL